jgi:hypothetical protein
MPVFRHLMLFFDQNSSIIYITDGYLEINGRERHITAIFPEKKHRRP